MDAFDGVETQKVLLGKGGYMWDRHTERPSNLVKVSDSPIGVEEPWQNICNLDVYDVHGEQIGTVEDLYADRMQAHLPRFLGVAAGGFLGIGKKHFLIPTTHCRRLAHLCAASGTDLARDKVYWFSTYERCCCKRADTASLGSGSEK